MISLILIAFGVFGPCADAHPVNHTETASCIAALQGHGLRALIEQFSAIEDALQAQPIVSKLCLREHQTQEGRALSGCTEGVQLWQFADGRQGVFKRENQGAAGEIAAYKMSEYLGLHIVPPTVWREDDDIKGSVQLYLKTSTDLLAENISGNKILRALSQQQWDKANLLHFVLGNRDRHTGNFLLDDAGELVSIDNADVLSRVLWRLGEHPWLMSKKLVTHLQSSEGEFPYDQPQFLEQPSAEGFVSFFKQFMGEKWALKLYENQFYKYPDGRFPYIVWQGHIWTQRISGFGPLTIHTLNADQLARLTDLADGDLEREFRGLLSAEKIDEIQARLQILIDHFSNAQ